MQCEEFLEDYSDFLDRRFEEHRLSDYSDHLLDCPTCAEYDGVVRRGLHLVRRLDPPDATPDLGLRIRRSVLGMGAGLERGVPRADRRVGVLAVAVTLAGLLAVASLPALQSGRGAVELPPVVVESPEVLRLSLWGPAPRFVPAVRLLQVDFPRDPLFAPPSDGLSAFRAPPRTATELEPVAPE